jgi:hypothetical protein
MSPKVQSAVAWIVAAVIGAGVVGLVVSQFMPPKTESKTEAPPPKTEALPPKIEAPTPKPAPVEDKQALRWVCSHSTGKTVTIMTGASGAFQAYMEQCDEWKLK